MTNDGTPRLIPDLPPLVEAPDLPGEGGPHREPAAPEPDEEAPPGRRRKPGEPADSRG